MTIFNFDFHFCRKCSFECSFWSFYSYYVAFSDSYFYACRNSNRKSTNS